MLMWTIQKATHSQKNQLDVTHTHRLTHTHTGGARALTHWLMNAREKRRIPFARCFPIAGRAAGVGGLALSHTHFAYLFALATQHNNNFIILSKVHTHARSLARTHNVYFGLSHHRTQLKLFHSHAHFLISFLFSFALSALGRPTHTVRSVVCSVGRSVGRLGG